MKAADKRLKSQAVLACVLLFSFCAARTAVSQTDDGTWINATGQAAGEGAEAESLALRDAQLQAIKSACGEKISSQTTTANMGSVNEFIVSRLSGYIKKCEVVGKKIADGKTVVSIRALVDKETAGDDIAALQYAAATANNPRIAVVIAQVSDDLFEDFVKNKSVERDITIKLEAEKRRFDDAKEAELYEMNAVDTRVSGDFRFWAGRPRPRNWTAWTSQERSDWVRTTAETEYRNAIVDINATESVKRQKTIWSKVTESVEKDGLVQATIEKYFVDNGLNVVSQTQMEVISQREMLLAGLSGNPDEVTAIHAKLGADILITGTATARRVTGIKVGEGMLYRYKGELVLRAYSADSGKLLAAENFSADINSTSPTGGADDALRAVAKNAARALAGDISDSWSKQWQGGKTINVIISGMTFSDWELFKAAVQTWPRVKIVRLRTITAGRADIEIQTDLESEFIAGRIVKIKKPAIEITGFEGTTLRGKIKQ